MPPKVFYRSSAQADTAGESQTVCGESRKDHSHPKRAAPASGETGNLYAQQYQVGQR